MERGLFEGALEDECLKEGIGVIPYYSLASGLPERQVPRRRPMSATSPRGAGVKKYINDKGLGVLKALDAAGQEAQRQPDAGGARLADAEQVDHRADRERHQPASSSRT